MPGIGHVAVGMAAGRAFSGRGATTRELAAAMVGLSVISWLPDADIITFYLGIAYLDPLGHRGASHSLFIAAVVMLVAYGLARALKVQRVARFTVLAGLVAASHGLLDSMTNGGHGCALLWPFLTTRYFAPVRPIPVSPLGPHLFTARGLYVFCVELVLFLPFFVYATAPRHNPSVDRWRRS